ncbi:hypothetical protein CLOM_g24342 [Closterium sp. NIES-68]|nr:hypothetical protein CLOM_g24342 [Closterium sp. NIES-68]
MRACGSGSCAGGRQGGGRRGVLARISGPSSEFVRARGNGSGSIDSAAAAGDCWLRGVGVTWGERGAFSGSAASTSPSDSRQRFYNTNGGSGRYSSVTVTCSAGGSPSLVAPAATSDSPSRVSILFAAGGTGGHVYPAVAVADAVRSRDPTAEINFVGTRERMEWTAVPRAGYPIHPIPAVCIRRPLLASLTNLLLPIRFLHALFLCVLLISRLKPDVVVGTGGYVSAPTCLAAVICRVPLVLQEQNAHAGIANRLLGRFATVVFVAFAVAQRFFPTRRCHVAGNPTRAVLRASSSRSAAAAARWAQQCGVRCFIDRMELAYAAADVVVARAAPCHVLGTASPLPRHASWCHHPHVAEDHQTVNARAMVGAGAAVMLPQTQLSPDTLLSAVTSLLGDDTRQETMRERAEAAATADAADVMAQEVLRLAEQHKATPRFAERDG